MCKFNKMLNEKRGSKMKKVEKPITFKEVALMFERLKLNFSVEEIMNMEVDIHVSDFVGGGK